VEMAGLETPPSQLN